MSTLMQRLAGAGSIKQSALLSQSLFFADKEQSPTDIPIIDLALSGSLKGGLTSGLTFLAGPSKHFKSLLGLVLVSAYMKKHPDAVCLFYDSEFGITPEYIETNGIDTDRVIHIPLEHLEQLKFDISKRLEEIKRGDKVIIFIDSVGNLASKKEVEDALDEKSVADMSRAKVMKSLWRIVTPHLTTKDIPCIAVNHTYNTMELYSKAIMSGGCLEAGVEILMADGSYRKIEEVFEGELVQTQIGPKEVTAIWNPNTLDEGEPECFEIEFEDGHKIVCSENHKFLTDAGWIQAKDLTDEDIVKLYLQNT